jgi:hypothetical protein
MCWLIVRRKNADRQPVKRSNYRLSNASREHRMVGANNSREQFQ